VDPDLDQAVRAERAFSLGHDGLAEASLADGDDWIEVMRLRPQGFSLPGIEHGLPGDGRWTAGWVGCNVCFRELAG
jgi:hypothetical protein